MQAISPMGTWASKRQVVIAPFGEIQWAGAVVLQANFRHKGALFATDAGGL